MGAMTLRNLDAEVTEALRRRASREGRSLNSLICEILARAAEDDVRRERMRAQRPRVEALRRRLEKEFGEGTPSEELIREDRRR
jgi:plasmid stability protein